MSSLRQTPLTCSGHTRPVVFLSFSDITPFGYFLISASKGEAEKLINNVIALKHTVIWKIVHLQVTALKKKQAVLAKFIGILSVN